MINLFCPSHSRVKVLILGLLCCFSLSIHAFQHSGVDDKVSRPALVLLKVYDGSQNVDGWLMSEKLDGVRAYWDGRVLWSRSGRRFNVPSWFTENFPPFELDGELWLKRDAFSEVVSIVQRKTAGKGWKNLTFQIFEIPNQQGGLLARLNMLELYLKQFPAPYLRIIEQIKVHGNADVETHLARIVALKGEGLVLRNPDVHYYVGRSHAALKVKLRQDAECAVVGYTEGKGKYAGKTGALKCQLIDFNGDADNAFNQQVIKVGSGLTDALRKTPPRIGTIVTFQYMGLTRTGLPRFPVYLREREK